MTAPTDLPIEDRLRAHFADRAGTTEFPGPESDDALARARDGLPLRLEQGADLAARRPRWARPLLAAAALLAVVALVAGVALARRDDGGDVSTDPTPPPTTAPPTAPEPPATTETTPDTTTSTSQPSPPPGALPTGPIVSGDGILGS